MFKVFFTSFHYGLDKEFDCLDVAIRAAKSHGFQCLILRGKDTIVGSWCPIGGFKQIKEQD